MINTPHEKDLTFIIHLRLDNNERKSNLNITLRFLNDILPESKIIIVEDDTVEKCKDICELYNNVEYIFSKNESSYRKGFCYNLGLYKSNTEYVSFLDIDCIVDKQNIIKSLNNLQKNNNAIFIGYNGICVYFKYNIKSYIKDIESNKIINYLNGLIDKQRLLTGYETENYSIGNTAAVGGLLIGSRNTFIKHGGFNPFFKGWGYEDNEIIDRFRRLGVDIFKINTNIPYLFHMPHTVEGERRDRHEFYTHNYNEYQKVLNMKKDDIFKYINQWTRDENS